MEPTLLPLNAEMTAFHTFFSVHGREFSFNIVKVPPLSSDGRKSSLKNAKLEGDLELRSLLAGVEPLVQQRLNQGTDVASFALEMKDILIVKSEDLLRPILCPEEVPVCVNGTYLHCLASIKKEGLKRMKRLHVHFATGLFKEKGVISGSHSLPSYLLFDKNAKQL